MIGFPRIWLIALALSALAIPSSAVARPCTPLRATMVIDISGEPKNFFLTRAGRRVPVGIFTRLADSDRLAVAGPASYLTVQLADRSVRRLRRSNGVLCIVQSVPSWYSNAWAELGELLTVRRKGSWYGIGRGGAGERRPLALGLPDLASGQAKVAAGERRMALLWSGGEPPFAVKVVGPDGRAIVDEADIFEQLLLLDTPRSIPSGAYRVAVRDARGAQAAGTFTALAAPGLRFSDPPSAGAALVEAARLYEAGPDRAFDAFMLLSPYYSEQEASTAGWMMGLLAEGRPGRGAEGADPR